MYSEITINIKATDPIPDKRQVSGAYYIVKDGLTQGPIKTGDPRLTGF